LRREVVCKIYHTPRVGGYWCLAQRVLATKLNAENGQKYA